MPAPKVYTDIYRLLSRHVESGIGYYPLERLALLSLGVIESGSAAPAQIAKALEGLHLSDAKPESIERRVRRIENDAKVTAVSCLHPLVRDYLERDRPPEVILILDPTTKEDQIVMLAATIWYRGRVLPVAWDIWPGNKPLTGSGFWVHVEGVLAEVASVLPAGTSVICLADRAFGSPAFIDLLSRYGWHYVLRVQGQTVCQDTQGRECTVRQLVQKPGQRAKLRGKVFKKRGWRECSVVVYWGEGHQSPLCLVSDLPPKWELIKLYRRRYPIEAGFRHYKSYGWHWEQSQVQKLAHMERLLVALALATWIAVLVGTQVADEVVAAIVPGRSLRSPWAAKDSLFSLGLQRLKKAIHSVLPVRLQWDLRWQPTNWQQQLRNYIGRAYLIGLPI